MRAFDEERFRAAVGEYIGHADADTVTEIAKEYFAELTAPTGDVQCGCYDPDVCGECSHGKIHKYDEAECNKRCDRAKAMCISV